MRRRIGRIVVVAVACGALSSGVTGCTGSDAPADAPGDEEPSDEPGLGGINGPAEVDPSLDPFAVDVSTAP